MKVQACGMVAPIMVYDESRTCQFDIGQSQRGFSEILSAVQKEKTWQGRKTFMKASFNERGDCIMYPTTAGDKSKYKW